MTWVSAEKLTEEDPELFGVWSRAVVDEEARVMRNVRRIGHKDRYREREYGREYQAERRKRGRTE